MKKMKNLNLDDYGVQEMNRQEMLSAEGGMFWLWVGILEFAYEVGPGLSEGLEAGYKAQQSK